MLALQMRRLNLEQQAYLFIREMLSHEFLADPVMFVTHFKARPEDLNGETLRAYYQHCLVQGLVPATNDSLFNKRFVEGRLFG